MSEPRFFSSFDDLHEGATSLDLFPLGLLLFFFNSFSPLESL